MMGLSSKRQNALLKYAIDAEKGAAITHADVMGMIRTFGFSSDEARAITARFPGVLERIEAARGGKLMNGPEKDAFIKEQLMSLLQEVLPTIGGNNE